MVLALAGDSTTTSFCAIACSIAECCGLGLVSSPPNLGPTGRIAPEFPGGGLPFEEDSSERLLCQGSSAVVARRHCQGSHPAQHRGAARHSHIPVAPLAPSWDSAPGI